MLRGCRTAPPTTILGARSLVPGCVDLGGFMANCTQCWRRLRVWVRTFHERSQDATAGPCVATSTPGDSASRHGAGIVPPRAS